MTMGWWKVEPETGLSTNPETGVSTTETGGRTDGQNRKPYKEIRDRKPDSKPEDRKRGSKPETGLLNRGPA